MDYITSNSTTAIQLVPLAASTSSNEAAIQAITSSDTSLETRLSKLRDEIKGGAKQAKMESLKFSISTRRALYIQLAQTYVLARDLMADPEKLHRLLEKNGLKQDNRPNSNPWVAPVNLIFGRRPEGALSWQIRPNQSAWKYAGSFRFFHENNWQPDAIPSLIENYKSTLGNKLLGTQLDDQYKYRDTDADLAEEKVLIIDFIAQAKSIIKCNKHAILNDDGKPRAYVALWGLVVEGDVHIYGELPNKSDMVSRYAHKVAKGRRDYIIAKTMDSHKPLDKQKHPPRPGYVHSSLCTVSQDQQS